MTTAMPTFADGFFIRQSDLNLLSNGVDQLSLALTGVPAPRSYVPTATAKINTTQATADRTDHVVAFNTGGVNNDVMWVAAASAFIINTGGVYVAHGQVCFSQNGTGTRSCSILLNGVAPDGNGVALGAEKAVSAGDLTVVTCQTQPMALAPGAALYLNAWQSSGGALNLNTGFSGTFLSVVRWGNQT